MSARIKRRHRMSFWDKADLDVLEATSESFRIGVDQAFHQFIANDSCKEHSFSANLSNLERKYIHQKAATYNLVSRSHGKDPARVLTIYKRGHKSNFESFDILLSEKSIFELDRVVNAYAPSAKGDTLQRVKFTDKVFGKLTADPPSLVHPCQSVNPQIARFQRELPIYSMKPVITQLIRSNRVVVISSETGSGKTTQIPQYIMEDARERNERCRILCTQPRRISAVSMAARVSHERGLDIGGAVGYHIRLESRLSTTSNLIYCTNGVLIRTLMTGEAAIEAITHVIIDEVHERDKLSDFLLICLRECLRRGSRLKVILMSATINVDKFKAYFDDAEVLSIPGRMFDVKEFFLDEILELTGYEAVVQERQRFFNESLAYAERNPQFDEVIDDCIRSGSDEDSGAWPQLLQYMLCENMKPDYQHSETGFTALMAAVYQNNVGVIEKLLSMGANPEIRSMSGCSALGLADDGGLIDVAQMLKLAPTRKCMSRVDLLDHYYKTCADDDINFDLLVTLLVTIHTSYKPGSILVFLPGYDDIMLCADRIHETPMDPRSYRVFFLHGSMSIREQNEVFRNLGSVRKIILSTNIAETSITIDDVVYVINCGKAKMQIYDSCSGLSTLQTQWISKACVKQRKGRAGRTQAGVCFNLFSKTRFDSLLDECIPEILRVPLEELCLNTKSLSGKITSIYNFLVMAPDPPSSNTVKTAIENLECLGALDKNEDLTPLGEYLSQITIEPHLGKMLIYSVIFKCLDPVLSIVASMTQKDPFVLPPQANLRSYAAEKRKSLMRDTLSDHMVYLGAFLKWQDSLVQHKERNFAKEYFISLTTMETILKIRSQLMGQLRAVQFVPATNMGIGDLNRRADNWPLVKAIIASGLYPKIAFKKNNTYCTRTENKVFIYNSSPLSKDDKSLWLVYDEMVKVRNGHHLRGVTPVTPLTISLMCGTKTTSTDSNCLSIDEWLEFEFATPHIINLRKHIDAIINKKLQSPANVLTADDEGVVNAMARMLLIEERCVNLVNPAGIGQRPRVLELQPNHHRNRWSDTATSNGYNAWPTPSTSSATIRVPPDPNAMFLLITVRGEKSVRIAFGSKRWVFSPQTEKFIMSLNHNVTSLYLVYTVPEAHSFNGIAKFLTMDMSRPKPAGVIEWIFKSTIPFRRTSNLRNSLNGNRLVYDAHDGQIIEASVALQLWKIFGNNESNTRPTSMVYPF